MFMVGLTVCSQNLCQKIAKHYRFPSEADNLEQLRTDFLEYHARPSGSSQGQRTLLGFSPDNSGTRDTRHGKRHTPHARTSFTRSDVGLETARVR